MEVITMESQVYKDLFDKIDKISAFVVKCEAGIKPQSNDEIWLDSQEVANLLRISTRTLQRLRSENLISYAILRGRCLYKLSEIERGLNERLITCDPHTLDEFRKNYLLSNGAK
ncbi:MAG: helix-turn-helix domain-containing protein [Mariniphaga sp.]|nr:helix-turn-helix domain-containing protein [Mariniphaga sp.]